MTSARLRPLAERPFTLVYRARSLPFYMGSWGQKKAEIGEKLKGVTIDIQPWADDATPSRLRVQEMGAASR